MAIALTSTSEAWDRFWDDINASDEDEDDDDGGGLAGGGHDSEDEP
jgi:hypothetical protein